MEEVHKKNYIIRFTHIDINFDVKYEGHPAGDQLVSDVPGQSELLFLSFTM